MKSFIEYLTESKRVYEFKVKIAGNCPRDCASLIKDALSMYHVESCSAGKSTPIQERQLDFPEAANVGVTVFEVCTTYPATSAQIRDRIAETAKIQLANVKVRNLAEEEEIALNHANSKKSGKAVLGTDYEKINNQKSAGDQHTMNFLKELQKTPRTTGQAYTGINSELLAKTAPKEKQTEQAVKQNNKSPVGSRKVKLPTAGGR